MKKMIFLLALFFALFHSPVYAAKLNCRQFSKEVENIQAANLKQHQELKNIETQLESGTKAVNHFNKNCRGFSGANCNPGTYNMIRTQMTILSGQRQRVEGQIIEASTRQEEALKNLKMCKSIKVQKTTL